MKPRALFPPTGLAIAGPPLARGWLLLALALAGCAPTETVDFLPVLEQGEFVAARDFYDLTPKAAGSAEEHYRFWIPKRLVPGEGWGRVGRGWRPVGNRSVLRFWPHHPEASSLYLVLHRRRLGRRLESKKLTALLSLNGEVLGETSIGPKRTRWRLPVGASLRDEVNELELRFEPPVRQPAVGHTSLGLTRFGLLEGGERPPGREEVTRDFTLNRAEGVLRLQRSGSLVVPWEVPGGATHLELEVRFPEAAGGALRIASLDAAGSRTELLGIETATGSNTWEPQRLPIRSLRGRRIFLVLEAEVAREGAAVAIRAPMLEVRGRRSDRDATSGTGRRRAGAQEGRRPDVLLLILDAARGDRFNGNYHRRTNPNIDRMAEGALVFGRAYSECPTTACSIPNLISGLSFLDMGEPVRARRLSEEVTTLAEYLEAAGYRTIGFSANPSNAKSRNMHQGFGRFQKLWGPNPHHGPYGMSELAEEVIRSQPLDEPLYLQLHYLPPHQPYEPLPRFDVFTDPEYAGSITPRMSLRPYRTGGRSLIGADLEHLVGLYDGNLLMADDAVSRVFEALEETGRWENTLILLTSDHGEAFMEHGVQGHNSTLFDEMLHVPFILRLPRGEIPDGVDTDRLVGLADAVPTILGRLGIEPEPEVEGVDLLHSAPDPGRPRVLFFRTSNWQRPFLGARTPKWKLVVWPRQQVQLLFDLESDPSETRNLVGERPLIFTGLGLELRRHLARTAPRGSLSEELELSTEERDALRALGYVE